MKIHPNPLRGVGMTHSDLNDIPFPLADASAAQALLARCPRADVTPLLDCSDITAAAGVGRVDVKDERGRMGLGSFKALGAAHVIARDAVLGQAAGRTYVTASAGNHGLSVAAGAAAFGAKAQIYLAETVPESFADRLRALGADVVRAGAIYEESMAAAVEAADKNGSALLSDSSWVGYFERPLILMEGYLVLMAEAVAQIAEPPTHIFLQAGVGGLAAAAAAHARFAWGDAPIITVVEPEFAPALIGSIQADAPTAAAGPVSIMGRLDCKEPSLIALKGLARDADAFATLAEAEGAMGTKQLAAMGLETSSSGSAGIVALLASTPFRKMLKLGNTSRVLCIASEEADA